MTEVSTAVDDLEASVRAELVEYRETQSAFVKAREIGDRLGLTASQVAPVFSKLSDEGALSKWGKSRATSWRIAEDLEAPAEAGDRDGE